MCWGIFITEQLNYTDLSSCSGDNLMNSTKYKAQGYFLLFCLFKPNHHTLFETVDRFLNKSELGLTPPLLLPPRIKKTVLNCP